MLTVRPAIPADRAPLLAMIHALAAHHGDPPACTEAALDRDVFGPAPALLVVVAEHSGLIGYAALTMTAQLQWGVRGLDMHHLFVDAGARRTGVGTALIAATQARARALGCAFVTVGTHPDNTRAQQFYRARGFLQRPDSAPHFVWRLPPDGC